MRFARYLNSAIIVALLLERPLGASMYVGSSSFVHPKIASGQMPIRSACLMPPKGQVLLLAVKLGSRHPDVLASESADWSRALQGVVQSHLKAAGVDTKTAAGPDSPDLQENLQQSYDALHPKLAKKPKEIASDSYTLGTDVAKLPCAANADVLVFVEATAQVQTAGRFALSMLATTSNDGDSHFDLSLVDAKSGQIVGFLNITNVRPSLYDPERTFGGALDKEFKKMNLGATASHP